MKINQTPPDTPLQTTVQDFDVLNKLGEGSFSTVYKVKRKSDGKIYALKKVKFGFLKPKEKENALSEIRILASLNNDNIIGYKEAFYDEKVKCLCIIQVPFNFKNTIYLHMYVFFIMHLKGVCWKWGLAITDKPLGEKGIVPGLRTTVVVCCLIGTRHKEIARPPHTAPRHKICECIPHE